MKWCFLVAFCCSPAFVSGTWAWEGAPAIWAGSEAPASGLFGPYCWGFCWLVAGTYCCCWVPCKWCAWFHWYCSFRSCSCFSRLFWNSIRCLRSCSFFSIDGAPVSAPTCKPGYVLTYEATWWAGGLFFGTAKPSPLPRTSAWSVATAPTGYTIGLITLDVAF